MNEVLKEGGRGSAGSRRSRWMTATLVVTELALTVVLLAGAGLMVRSFMKLYTLDLGIDTRNLMTMRMELPDEKYKSAELRRAFYQRLEPRLASIPGVDAVSLTTSVPPFGSWRRDIEIEGHPILKSGDARAAAVVTISPAFFESVRVQLRRGRTFHDTDGAPGSETVIINDRLASQFFPGEDPIGRRIRFAVDTRRPAFAGTAPPTEVWRTIVGISPVIKHSNPQDADPPGALYVPYRQDPPRGVTLLVRSRLEPNAA